MIAIWLSFSFLNMFILGAVTVFSDEKVEDGAAWGPFFAGPLWTFIVLGGLVGSFLKKIK